MKKTELFRIKPDWDTPPLLIAGGFLSHQNEFLLLKRHPAKSYGLYWNLPAGKLEPQEDPKKGAQREIYEETGIVIPLEGFHNEQIFYLTREDLLIQFHVYQAKFDHKPTICLKLDENIEAVWTSHQEALKLPLLGGGLEILSCYLL